MLVLLPMSCLARIMPFSAWKTLTDPQKRSSLSGHTAVEYESKGYVRTACRKVVNALFARDEAKIERAWEELKTVIAQGMVYKLDTENRYAAAYECTTEEVCGKLFRLCKQKSERGHENTWKKIQKELPHKFNAVNGESFMFMGETRKLGEWTLCASCTTHSLDPPEHGSAACQPESHQMPASPPRNVMPTCKSPILALQREMVKLQEAVANVVRELGNVAAKATV